MTVLFVIRTTRRYFGELYCVIVLGIHTLTDTVVSLHFTVTTVVHLDMHEVSLDLLNFLRER